MKVSKVNKDHIVTDTSVNDVLSLLRRSKYYGKDASPAEMAREAAKRIMEAARKAKEAIPN